MDEREKLAPNFLLIGAGKSATTSIAAQIAQHPDIFVPKIKEPHYFTFNHVKGWDWYLGLFENAAGRPLRGEASVTYSQAGEWPGTAQRIFDALGPDCRLIYIMRRPPEALASHFFHDLSRGHLPVGTKLQDHVFRSGKYVDARLYDRQLGEYLRLYPKTNFLFLTYEDYVADPQSVLTAIFRFLGVDEAFTVADMTPKNVSAGQLRKPAWYRALRSLRRRHDGLRLPAPLQALTRSLVNAGSRAVEAPQLTPEDEARVWALVRDDVEALSATIGRDMIRFWNVPAA